MNLSIIVPYRNRPEHLAEFIAAVPSYIGTAGIAGTNSVKIVFVEQSGDESLNRGALKNAGFQLTRGDADYVCFHDIDFLPLDADYSCPSQPTRAIWRGAESRPVVDGGPLVIRHNYDSYFGGVVLFTCQHFELVNGYSNGYWGWGYEDVDLRMRCLAAGLSIAYRDGSFRPLDHRHDGWDENLSLSAEAQTNRRRFEQTAPRLVANKTYRHDGLNTLRFAIDNRHPLAEPQGIIQQIELVTVAIEADLIDRR